MHLSKLILILALLFGIGLGCKDHTKEKKTREVEDVKPVEKIGEDIKRELDLAYSKNGKLNDSVSLNHFQLLDSVYTGDAYEPVWSNDQHWTPLSDSLYTFIENSKEYGLFPADYHSHAIGFLHRIFETDTVAKKNLVLWARADIMLTDAFFRLVKDLKLGRLPHDSVTLRTDTLLSDQQYLEVFRAARQSGSVTGLLHELEPRLAGYDSIKAYIKSFLAKARFTPFTYLTYPFKDSLQFFRDLEKRLHETGFLPADQMPLDSIEFRNVLRRYQKSEGLKVTGRASDETVDRLNFTDLEKFKKIAVNLDRYKQLPDTLPATRAWVNLPSYMLEVYDGDSLVFRSRIICGGPKTRTPLLTSEISNFITLPQWTVPYSIIFKEMLPKIQQSIEFLNKENLMVVDQNDSVIDPATVNWKKLNKNHFPYLLKQRQGDDNSLGVIKFNFRNKYAVYLHDTNVRWRFGQSYRAISHGCVRVKEWSKLADFLIRKDTLKYHSDTIRAWIDRKEKHVVSGFTRLPLFIRYFTCEGKDGRIKFYEDIYEEDRYLREKYFANKTVD